MPTFTVSIGRRIGTGPELPIADWRRFRAGVEGAVTDAAEAVYFAGLGGGVFEGVYEESATWVFEAAVLPAIFTRELAALAARHGQESIAVTEGRTTFVEAAVRKGVAA